MPPCPRYAQASVSMMQSNFHSSYKAQSSYASESSDSELMSTHQKQHQSNMVNDAVKLTYVM